MPADAATWLKFADDDLAAARRLIGDLSLPPRLACFHAQQAAEKAVKAALAAAGTPFPRTHDLLALALLTSDRLRAELESVELSLLDPWAVDARYPADIPDLGVSEANVVLDTAAHTLRAVRAVLTSIDPQ